MTIVIVLDVPREREFDVRLSQLGFWFSQPKKKRIFPRKENLFFV